MTEDFRIKTCGMARYEDARLALDLGAWALGFIFHRPSPRAIEPDVAREIVRRLPSDTLTVGVFVDRPLQEIESTVEHVGLRGVQLHGRETPGEVAAVTADVVVKAFRVGEAFDPSVVDRYDCDYVLLDTYRKGLPGGTGETFDWTMARLVGERRPTIVAGGIGPQNVREAIRTACPHAIDVSSAVELSPGVKDAEKMRALFRVVGGDGRAGGRPPV